MVSTIVMFPSNVNSARRNPSRSRVPILNKSGSKKYAKRIAILLLLGVSVNAMNELHRRKADKEEVNGILMDRPHVLGLKEFKRVKDFRPQILCQQSTEITEIEIIPSFDDLILSPMAFKERLLQIMTHHENTGWESQFRPSSFHYDYCAPGGETDASMPKVHALVSTCDKPNHCLKILTELLRNKKDNFYCIRACKAVDAQGVNLLHHIIDCYQLGGVEIGTEDASEIVDLLQNKLGTGIFTQMNSEGQTPLMFAQEVDKKRRNVRKGITPWAEAIQKYM